MKKFILFLVFIAFSTSSIAQQQYSFKIDTKAKKAIRRGETNNSSKNKTIKYQGYVSNRDTDIVTIIDIGTSANISDFARSNFTIWVDPQLSTVSFYHRMGGDLDPLGNAGDLGYDISTDGGENWDLMIRNFYFGDMWGGYPMHGIFNPSGNTNPDDAYVVYSLSGADDGNSGLVHGSSNIGDTSIRNQSFVAGGAYASSPRGFDLTSTGEVFIVTPDFDSWDYQDSLLITKGIWNESIMDFTYETTKIEAIFMGETGSPVDVKIAFGSDGQIGYISVLGNNGMATQQSGFVNNYPIYWKTIDGGETWAGPEFIQLDGPEGLNNIVYHHLTNELIEELFGDNPPAREDISYTTAFDHDIVVDANGDLNIAVVIGPSGADPYSIITAEGYLAARDIFYSDDNWYSQEMGRILKFRGYFGDLTEDNRIQITTDQDREYVFISWLDTDHEDAEDNDRPNIWCRGFHPITFGFTRNSSWECQATNVTLFSEGMWKSYFGSTSKYIFSDGGIFNIPFVYAKPEAEDFSMPVQYKYVQDFSFSIDDFYNCTVGIEERVKDKNFNVSNNSPNPFHEKTTFEIELNKNTDIHLQVFSTDGKLVFDKVYNNMSQGKNKILFNAKRLKQGVYFYTFTVNGSKLSGKMMIY